MVIYLIYLGLSSNLLCFTLDLPLKIWCDLINVQNGIYFMIFIFIHLIVIILQQRT